VKKRLFVIVPCFAVAALISVVVILRVVMPRVEWVVRGTEAGMKSNVPIVFYGRVADLAGMGISSATASVRVTSFDVSLLAGRRKAGGDYTSQKHTTIECVTDDDGCFRVEARGQVLKVMSIQKKDYSTLRGESMIFPYWHGYASFHTPDPVHPATFRMRYQGDGLNGRHGDASRALVKTVRFKVPADGAEHRIDLIRGVRLEGSEGVSDLNIQVKCSIPSERGQRRYDWDLLLEVPDGGLSDAPDQGGGEYTPRYHLPMPQALPTWSGRIEKKLHIRSRNGTLDDTFHLTVYAYRDGQSLVKISAL